MFAPLGVLTLSLLIGAGALAAYARQDPAAARQAPVIGSVDMLQIYDSSDAPQLVEQQANREDQTVIQLTTRIAATAYLGQDELAEYLKLITATDRSPVQEARLTELSGLSDRRGQELDALRIKKEADLSAADRTRMQQLQQQGQRFQQSIMPRIQQSLQLDERGRIDAFRRDQIKRLRAVVSKVAAARGITDVWDTESLIYSVNDLTAEVIRALKKK
jgi:Skp family chaperone for outer membrane proteins